MEQIVSQFIATYVPSAWLLIFLVTLHVVLSTIAHLKNKSFKFSQWPNFLKMWLLFMTGIVAVNAVIVGTAALASASILSGALIGLQAFVYAMYIGYYVDNVFTSLNLMGLPVSPELSEVIKSITNKVKNSFTGGV